MTNEPQLGCCVRIGLYKVSRLQYPLSKQGSLSSLLDTTEKTKGENYENVFK